jgi:Na+/H+ antiporter NhaD/arsenite permease-like protein
VLLASLALAAAALASGLVHPREVAGLLDTHVLGLFFVLIAAVECAKHSGLFAALVRRTLSRVTTERGLAVGAVLATGSVAACVTNDVALLLVVPFTLAFEAADPALDPAPIVVLEIAAANLTGCITPAGNPQNLFLYARGGFSPRSFFAAQVPWALGMTLATLALVPLVTKRRVLARPQRGPTRVDRPLAASAVLLLVLEFLALFHAVPGWVPVAAAVPGVAALRRRIRLADFALVFVFAALFVGIEGLRRSALFQAADPLRVFGSSPRGFVAAGALLSQGISNVPAAILLAPDAARAGGAAFVGLLYGVNAGGCGTPIASLANLIGASLYLDMRGARRRRFLTLFLTVPWALLAFAVALSMALAPP